MTNSPNYQRISPPPEKDPTEYTFAERRAELFDMIQRQGGYRNLNKSQRALGERYGVVHRTIQKDIDRILAWKDEHLGEHAESELSLVQGRGVQDYLQAAKEYREKEQYEKAGECMAKAYELSSDHLEDLQEAGLKDKAPDKTEITGSGGGALEIVINDSVVESDEALEVESEIDEPESDES